MKLHLISITINGIRRSGFFLFPDGEKPTLTPYVIRELGLEHAIKGQTFTLS